MNPFCTANLHQDKQWLVNDCLILVPLLLSHIYIFFSPNMNRTMQKKLCHDSFSTANKHPRTAKLMVSIMVHFISDIHILFQSAFTNFVSDEFRTLPDMDDRWVLSSILTRVEIFNWLAGPFPRWWLQIGHMAGLLQMIPKLAGLLFNRGFFMSDQPQKWKEGGSANAVLFSGGIKYPR